MGCQISYDMGIMSCDTPNVTMRCPETSVDTRNGASPDLHDSSHVVHVRHGHITPHNAGNMKLRVFIHLLVTAWDVWGKLPLAKLNFGVPSLVVPSLVVHFGGRT